MAVTSPLPPSDSLRTFNSDFGEVVSEVEGTISEAGWGEAALILPISLTNEVPQKDEEYFVTYCQKQFRERSGGRKGRKLP